MARATMTMAIACPQVPAEDPCEPFVNSLSEDICVLLISQHPTREGFAKGGGVAAMMS